MIPLAIPVAEPINAIAVLLLAQVPPVVLEVRVVDDPTQTPEAPVIAAGPDEIVTTLTAKHPLLAVKVTGAVPADMPISNPVAEPIAAVLPALEDQVPVPVPVSVTDEPTHTADAPVMAGVVLTVTVRTAIHPPVE